MRYLGVQQGEKRHQYIFSIGYFVVVRRAVDFGHNLKLRWFGPCRITTMHGDLIFAVTILWEGNYERLHCSRLLKYHDSLLGTPVPAGIMGLAVRTE